MKYRVFLYMNKIKNIYIICLFLFSFLFLYSLSVFSINNYDEKYQKDYKKNIIVDFLIPTSEFNYEIIYKAYWEAIFSVFYGLKRVPKYRYTMQTINKAGQTSNKRLELMENEFFTKIFEKDQPYSSSDMLEIIKHKNKRFYDNYIMNNDTLGQQRFLISQFLYIKNIDNNTFEKKIDQCIIDVSESIKNFENIIIHDEIEEELINTDLGTIKKDDDIEKVIKQKLCDLNSNLNNDFVSKLLITNITDTTAKIQHPDYSNEIEVKFVLELPHIYKDNNYIKTNIDNFLKNFKSKVFCANNEELENFIKENILKLDNTKIKIDDFLTKSNDKQEKFSKKIKNKNYCGEIIVDYVVRAQVSTGKWFYRTTWEEFDSQTDSLLKLPPETSKQIVIKDVRHDASTLENKQPVISTKQSLTKQSFKKIKRIFKLIERLIDQHNLDKVKLFPFDYIKFTNDIYIINNDECGNEQQIEIIKIIEKEVFFEWEKENDINNKLSPPQIDYDKNNKTAKGTLINQNSLFLKKEISSIDFLFDTQKIQKIPIIEEEYDSNIKDSKILKYTEIRESLNNLTISEEQKEEEFKKKIIEFLT